MTAHVYDLLSVMQWQWLSSHGVKGLPTQPPPSILPHEEEPVPEPTAKDIVKFFGA